MKLWLELWPPSEIELSIIVFLTGNLYFEGVWSRNLCLRGRQEEKNQWVGILSRGCWRSRGKEKKRDLIYLFRYLFIFVGTRCKDAVSKLGLEEFLLFQEIRVRMGQLITAMKGVKTGRRRPTGFLLHYKHLSFCNSDYLTVAQTLYHHQLSIP